MSNPMNPTILIHDAARGVRASSSLLRRRTDRRGLLWSLGLFPLPIALAIAMPRSAVWILPLTLYLAFCAGVLTHYHNHLGVFRSRTLNRIYSVWLSVFYGFPIFSWIPTHNQNHHKYVNGPLDKTSTFRSGKPDGLLEALTYPIRSSAWQLPAVLNYLRNARAKGGAEFAWLVLQIAIVPSVHIALGAALVYLHGAALGLLSYAASALVPALLAPYFMMLINYLQHVGCDPNSADNHSRNFVGRWENWLVFEAGLHTVHHEHPGTHFSEYPRLHALREARIDPILKQRNVLTFLWSRYVMRSSKHILLPAPELRG